MPVTRLELVSFTFRFKVKRDRNAGGIAARSKRRKAVAQSPPGHRYKTVMSWFTISLPVERVSACRRGCFGCRWGKVFGIDGTSHEDRFNSAAAGCFKDGACAESLNPVDGGRNVVAVVVR